METILIVGGKLQGLECAYLAAEAGLTATVIDRNPSVPAKGIAARFICADALNESSMLPLMASSDAVVPALEDATTLETLTEFGKRVKTPVLCDLEAYRLTSSKAASNRLFEALGIPVPKAFPDCGFPVIVKPDGSSGSQGVACARSQKELDALLAAIPGRAIVQEFVEGRSFSIEVIGDGTTYHQYPITEVRIAPDYDSERIVAPARLSPLAATRFRRLADVLGRTLRVRGIFDIEVIVRDDIPYILEIDARFPSQTPISIYHATGINLLEELLQTTAGPPGAPRRKKNRICLYQQVEKNENGLKIIGEHPLSLCGPLRKIPGFFGSDAALTDCNGGPTWRAIVIIVADSCAEAEKRWQAFQQVACEKPQTNREKRADYVTTH